MSRSCGFFRIIGRAARDKRRQLGPRSFERAACRVQPLVSLSAYQIGMGEAMRIVEWSALPLTALMALQALVGLLLPHAYETSSGSRLPGTETTGSLPSSSCR